MDSKQRPHIDTHWLGKRCGYCGYSLTEVTEDARLCEQCGIRWLYRQPHQGSNSEGYWIQIDNPNKVK